MTYKDINKASVHLSSQKRLVSTLLSLAMFGLGIAAQAAPLKITTTNLPAATVGIAYGQTVAVTGGTPPYKWVQQSGGFPPGLTLNGTNGLVGGTPTASGSWIYSYPFSVYIVVTDSVGANTAASFGIKDNPPAGLPTSGSSGTPTPTPPPSPSTYSVTVINGTANGVASGNFAPGTIVTLKAGNPPAGQWFKQWNGNVPVGNSLASPTTFTMPSSSVNVTALFSTPTPVPQPVASHPRLWITTNDLPRLQSWASPTNPVYQNLRVLLNQCLSTYNTKFYPGGVVNPTYPDLGDTQGYTGELSEQHALVFALFSLIDSDPNARIQHAQRARNLIVNALTEVAKGHQAGAPFRDPLFALFNRANFTSEAWPLAVDWIYNATLADGTPILSAADKLTIRDAFLIWANDCLNAYVCGGDHPAPIGTINSTALLPGGNAHRVAANNYYGGHARLITLMSLSLDPADDPAVNPATPLAVFGNSLRSYIPNATGAWLYQQYAMFGDPQSVMQDYQLTPTAKVGLASGGLSPEGGLYSHSYSYIMGELLALQTAGFNDSILSGPQSKLIGAPVWDRYLDGFLHTMVPAAKVYPSQPWLGSIYQIANYGDVLRLWVTPDFMQAFSLRNLLEQKLNNSSNSGAPNARLNATRWLALNAVEGGAAGLNQRIQQPWSYGVQNALLYFLLLDPAAPVATDPRPAVATSFYDPSQGRMLARTDWSPSASVFTFRSSWESINHQDGDAGQFEFYRKGEWLTKELSNYDNNGNGQSSMWHNALALQNWCAAGVPSLNFFEAPYWPNGSQWNNGMSAGDPVSQASSGFGYSYVQTDMTKLYNRPNQWTPAQSATDIQHASRSILWLNPDHIIVYDRATSLHNGFKRFNLNFATTPVINPTNRTVRATTPGGQRLYVSSLLPANATLSYVPEGGTLSNIAQLETMTGRLVVEDPSKPADTRFLHVLQGADNANFADPSTIVQSAAGTAFDGAVILDTAVFFAFDLSTLFQGTTLLVPATVAHVFITGLAPATGYGVTAIDVPSGVQIQLTVGGQTATTDAAGVLNIAL